MKNLLKLKLLLFFLALTFVLNSCKKNKSEPPAAEGEISLSAIRDINTTNAIAPVTFTTTGDFNIGKKGVCWATTEHPSISNANTNEGSDAFSFNSKMQGLQTNTTYFVRAYYTTTNGDYIYSNQVSFKTTGSGGGGALTLTTVDTEYFGTNVSVKIQVAGTATMREWGICYSTNQTPTTSNAKNLGTILPNTTNMSTSVLASPIQACVKYYVRAYAISTTGQTYYGNELSFKATGILNDCHPFNGFWKNSAGTIVFQGNFEHFNFYSIAPTPKPEYGWRNALDRNLIALGNSYIYNLVRKTETSWGCTVLWTKSNSGATLTEDVKPAANSTLTLSSDEKSVTITSTSPFGTGPGSATLYKQP